MIDARLEAFLGDLRVIEDRLREAEGETPRTELIALGVRFASGIPAWLAESRELLTELEAILDELPGLYAEYDIAERLSFDPPPPPLDHTRPSFWLPRRAQTRLWVETIHREVDLLTSYATLQATPTELAPWRDGTHGARWLWTGPAQLILQLGDWYDALLSTLLAEGGTTQPDVDYLADLDLYETPIGDRVNEARELADELDRRRRAALWADFEPVIRAQVRLFAGSPLGELCGQIWPLALEREDQR